MSDFLRQLKSLTGQNIRLHFYIGGTNSFIPDDESYLFEGMIESVDGGVLTFRHIEDEQVRIGIDKSILNLECVSIWAIDIPSQKSKEVVLDEDS